MKSYKQFVTESRQLDEGLGTAIAKGLSYVTGGNKVGAATKILNAVGAVYAADRGYDSFKRGDKTGMYNAGLMAVPFGHGMRTNAIKLGAGLFDYYRQQKKAEEERKKLDNKVTGK